MRKVKGKIICFKLAFQEANRPSIEFAYVAWNKKIPVRPKSYRDYRINLLLPSPSPAQNVWIMKMACE